MKNNEEDVLYETLSKYFENVCKKNLAMDSLTSYLSDIYATVFIRYCQWSKIHIAFKIISYSVNEKH